MAMEKYLYFRTQADQDDDDGNDDSHVFSASRMTGMYPGSDTTLILSFLSVLNFDAGVDANQEVTSDLVTLNVTAHRHKKVMQSITRAINSGGTAYGDGFITVADDVTTTYLTSSASADETVSAQYIDSDITSCGAITILAQIT